MRAKIAAALTLTVALPGVLPAQESGRRPEQEAFRIDSVAVRAENVFDAEAAERSWIYDLANSLRFQTRPGVVERELLFEGGDTVGVAVLQETERNLRALDLFRLVEVDTVVTEGRVVAVVHTQDAWSTLPILSGSFASDGTLTGRIGITERNVLGTGNLLGLAYIKGTDRDGGEVESRWRRVAGTEVDVAADLSFLSDGNAWAWSISDPWRALEDRFLLRLSGSTVDRQRLQYRTLSATRRDTLRYRHHLYAQRLTVGTAAFASQERILRFEASALLRNERYLRRTDGEEAVGVPDSVFLDVGLFATYEEPRYRVVGYLDGLNQQDVDLTTGITVGLLVASSAFGYERSGIGPHLSVRGGATSGPFLFRASLLANGLFNGAGLDSGRVVASVTGGVVTGDRHATLLHVQGGVLASPAPGREFDLGFSTPPRSFEPHAFVGTRSLWGTAEHRWYVLPRVFDQFGAALAAYFDFGGAWYADQDARWGAEVGVGLRTSSRLSPAARSSRIDVGYRVGGDIDGSRVVLTIGTGFSFF